MTERKMKILITGGAGFIGSHLVEKLVADLHEVVVIDDLSTGNISNLSNVTSKISLIQSKIEVFDLSTFKNFDAVVHLAAQTSVPLSIANFGASSAVNLLGSIKIIDHCSKYSIPLVYASSSAVYGNLYLGDDNRTSVDLISPYATDKYVMELYARLAFELYQLPSIGLRFFNVYGPRQDPTNPYSGVISIFIDKVKNKCPVTINGGYQTRDFVYVEDVANTIAASINRLFEKNNCDYLNVLSGTSTSIDTLFDKICDALNYRPKIYRNELSLGDCEKSEGTIEKFQEIFPDTFKNLTSLDEGLQKTIGTN